MAHAKRDVFTIVSQDTRQGLAAGSYGATQSFPSPCGEGLRVEAWCRTEMKSLAWRYPRRILTGGVPKACEKLRENAAADENPVRSATSAMLTRVSTTSRRAALNLSLR